MTRAEQLLALADRCEKVSGPDREIDAGIWLAVTPGATRRELVVPANETRRGWTIDETRDASCRLIIVPSYTASLDAAMMLVPEGCGWRIWAPSSDSKQRHRATIWAARGMPLFAPFDVEADTPALALTASCLRALAQDPHNA